MPCGIANVSGVLERANTMRLLTLFAQRLMLQPTMHVIHSVT